MGDNKSTRDVEFGSDSEGESSTVAAKIKESAPEVEASPTPSNVESEDVRVTGLQQEVAELQDKYMRALADFENYKKRAIKERSELLKYQGERILVDLVEVLDNLSLALQYKDSEPQKLAQGLELVHKMFVDSLSKWEVRPVSAVGKEFDPTRYEALSRVPVDDATPGTVIKEIKSAFMYKDKLLRAGSVIVACERDPAPQKEPGAAETEEEQCEED